MAPKPDDRLQDLYRQRKAGHRAPDRLNRAILAHARLTTSPRQPRWIKVVTPVAAACVVVVLGLNWLRDPTVDVMESQPMMAPSETTADTSKEMADADDASPEGLALDSPPRATAQDRADPSSTPAPDSFLTQDRPNTAIQSETRSMAQPIPDSRPRYLRALPDASDDYEGCDGNRLTMRIDAAPEDGWFEVTWTPDGHADDVKPLSTPPCDSAKPITNTD